MTFRAFAAAVISACSLAGTGHASFDANISSYINVQIPVQMHTQNVSGGIEHSRAHFGAHWDLGKQEGHMAHMTHDAQGDLCSMPDDNITDTFGEPPFFLIADMDGCTPISKARQAQELGAAGLILVNHHCLCSEDCEHEKHCVERLPFLHDDGSGSSIGIPTMLIGKGKGEHIKTALREEETVVMEMAWHMPKHEHNVSVALWYTPTHESTEEFLANFSSLAMVLQDRLDFHPFPYIMDGKKMNCYKQANGPDSVCNEMCTNNGLYCSVTHHGINGTEVVIESLRRMCVWKHYAEKGFWEYVKHFQTLCQSSDFFSRPKCITDVFGHSNIKENKIEECMKDSGDIEKDVSNTLLEKAMEESEHVLETPGILINWLPMRWPLYTKTVFEAFCWGFATGKAPHVCDVCAYCGDPVACASRSPMHCNPHDGKIPDPKKSSTDKKSGGGFFWKFMLVVFILTGAGGYVYYKKYMEDGGNGLSGYSLGEALMSDTA